MPILAGFAPAAQDSSMPPHIGPSVGNYFEGVGTVSNPYKIQSKKDLVWLQKVIADAVTPGVQAKYNSSSTYYELTNDILFEESDGGQKPIGSSTRAFKANFNGNNKKIEKLTISMGGLVGIGLFGRTDSAKITSINLVDCSVISGYEVGAIVGTAISTDISNCNVTGNVTGSASTGGIVGTAYGNTLIEKCSFKGTVTTTNTVGGIVGYVLLNNAETAKISESFSTGAVIAMFNGAGGIVGEASANASSRITIENCYSSSDVRSLDNAGGIAASVATGAVAGNAAIKIDTCYATGNVVAGGGAGGIVGRISNPFLGKGVEVIRCLVINQFVGGSGATDVGSIVGKRITGGIINFTQCAAYNDIQTLGGAVVSSSGLSSPYSAADILSGTGIPMAFKSSPWSYTANELPTLINLTAVEQNKEFPPHMLTNNRFFEGNGTTANPFKIKTTLDLDKLSKLVEDPNPATQNTYNTNIVHYRLENDISLVSYIKGESWKPIGSDTPTPFRANFDGNGKTISDLYLESTFIANRGLFGVTNGAAIKNLSLYNVEVTGAMEVGGLVGNAISTTITNCNVTGLVNSNGSTVGGIVGKLDNNSAISNSWFSGTVYSPLSNVGGIAGHVIDNSEIRECYALGSVTGLTNTVGGIAGSLSLTSKILDSYALNDVKGDSFVGGIAGSFDGFGIFNCYSDGIVSGNSNVGGIVGGAALSWGSINNCVALNEEVTAATSGSGRVAGSSVMVTIDKNHAFDSMDNKGIAFPVGQNTLTGLNGQDLAIPRLSTADFWLLDMAFNPAIWTIADTKLPILKNVSGNQTGEPNFHLTGLPKNALTMSVPGTTHTITQPSASENVSFTATGQTGWTYNDIVWAVTPAITPAWTPGTAADAILPVPAWQFGAMVITATNPNSGQVATSTLTFNVPTPVITATTSNPASGTVGFGQPITLDVTADAVPIGSTRTYQWYVNTTNSNVGGVIAEGVSTNTSYTPPTMTAGTKYYYVVVTNTNLLASGPTKTASATSNPYTVTVNNVTPAIITTHPQDKIVTVGDIVNLDVVATGSGTLSYQWYKNNVNSTTGATIIAGATSSSYQYTSTAPGSEFYFVEVTNTVGAVTASINSNIAEVKVSAIPLAIIITHPQNTTVMLGDNVNLNVVATGSGTLSYQWYKNNVNSTTGATIIAGATNPSYQYTSTALGSEFYFVEVTNTVAAVSVSINSNIAEVITTAIPVAIITTHPQSQIVTVGDNVNLNVAATGSGTLSYQWYKNNVNSTAGATAVAGATNPSYQYTSTALGSEFYFVEVTNTVAAVSVSINSNIAEVITTAIPVAIITTHPQSQIVTVGDNVNLNVAATGSGTLSYQWYKNNVNSTAGATAVAGATNPSYQYTSTALGSEFYFVEVTNTVAAVSASINSNIAEVKVSAIPLAIIITHPQGKIVTVGDNVNLDVVATGSGTLSYQWYKNNVNSYASATAVAGATNPSYQYTSTAPGSEFYFVEVTNTVAAVTVSINSNIAEVVTTTVPLPPVEIPNILTHPQNQTVIVGANVSLSTSATVSSGTLSYQWYKNSTTGTTAVLGATNPTYQYTTTTPGIEYYYVAITNTDNGRQSTVNTNVATVVINSNIVIPPVVPPVNPPVIQYISGGSGGSSTAKNDLKVKLYDANNKLINTYEVNASKYRTDTLKIDAANDMEEYNFAFDIDMLQTLGNNYSGNFAITVPGMTYTVPYSVITNINGLQVYLDKLNVSGKNLDLRLNIKKLVGKELEKAKKDYSLAYPKGELKSDFYDISFGLYNLDGTKQDISLDNFTKRLGFNIGGKTDRTLEYLKESGSFRFVAGNGNNSIVRHHSIYVATKNNMSFEDSDNHWGKTYINKAANAALIFGVGNNKYEPDRSVTRAEFTQLLVNALQLTEQNDVNYSDVSKSKWYYNALTKAQSAGLLNSFSGENFNPDEAITREETAAMLTAAAKYEGLDTKREANLVFSDSSQISQDKINDVAFAYQSKLMQGMADQSFSPQGNTTRAQASVVLIKLLEMLKLI